MLPSGSALEDCVIFDTLLGDQSTSQGATSPSVQIHVERARSTETLEEFHQLEVLSHLKRTSAVLALILCLP